MFHLRNRTEFSFHTAFGAIEKVLATNQGKAAGICDIGGTWGHVQWEKACKEKGIKPLFGAEIAVVSDMERRESQAKTAMCFIARNQEGLKELYQLVSLATEKMYYEPRLDYSVLAEVSENLVILSGLNMNWERLPKHKHLYIELCPTSMPSTIEKARAHGYPIVATSDNFFPTPDDRRAYEIVVDRNVVERIAPQHIIDEWEWRRYWDCDEAIMTTYKIAEMCSASLTHAELVKPEREKSLEQMCVEAAPEREIDLEDSVYKDRLRREIDLIVEKDFEDYFHLVADMCRFAKEQMFVGPARGSSCGSLVCYLLGITDIDPIPYGLLFERFIDINRADLPDIDIDFQDDRRELVFDYLREKYGYENVTRLGTISRFKAKSTIGIVSKALGIPFAETEDLKGSIIERSGGDARAQFCIMDTFQELEVGRKTLEKYPQLSVAADIEGHASHTGQHAAGILVLSRPATDYCAVDMQTGAVQLDKKDAESINMLKIDCLGLRTLSILQDTLDQIGWDREKLIRYPTDDPKAFEIINNHHFAAIFQFEGAALQGLCQQIEVEGFEDIVALTALSRPGPLVSGGANRWLERRRGAKPVEFMHPLTEGMTKVTLGIVVYQEQVMQIAREVGELTWEEVSELRKAMSKSLGKEYFDRFWQKFLTGAKKNGLKEEEAKTIWDNINTMGSWAFNRSHAVAYGTISYWCCVLKAYFPLEFAAACLRKAKDEEQSIQILRELVAEGYKYQSFDKEHSDLHWTVKDGRLVGGLVGVKGIGEKTAQDILERRNEGRELTPRQQKLLENGTTPWDTIYEAKERFGHIYENPIQYNIASGLKYLGDIKQGDSGHVVFIGKLTKKKLRDLNEPIHIERRGGKKMSGQTLYLFVNFEDDTGMITGLIGKQHYLQLGLPIIEDGKIGDWYLIKGKMNPASRQVYIARWKKLSGSKLDRKVEATGASKESAEPSQKPKQETRKRKAKEDRQIGLGL